MDELSFERRLTETEARSKSNTHQIQELKDRQDNLDKLVSSVSELATEQKYMKADIGEIKEDVKKVVEAPAKRWDALISSLISLVAGAFLMWLASGMPGA